MTNTLSGEIGYWIGEASAWPCTCGGAEMFFCNRCHVYTSLRSAAEHIEVGNLAGAARAVRRAAQIEGRLDDLRDLLEAEVHSAPYEEMEIAIGSAPVRADEARFPGCGMTIADHREITADVIRRECELERIADLHDPEHGTHLALANHSCGSTLSWPLPYHRDDHVEDGQ